MKPLLLIAPLLIALSISSANAQSLFLTEQAEQPIEEQSTPILSVEQVSLVYVAPPEPRVIKEHDIITIIIDEVSSMTSSQSLDTKKESTANQRLNSIVDFMALLELEIASAGLSNVDLLNFTSKTKFIGEGDYERKDKFIARITAQVLEIKPNGTMVLQATKRIAKDEEIQVLIMSGIAREQDITEQNTILSSQMANLNLVVENEGELKNTSEKGLFTRILDTVFAF
ncbi:MAG: flagellar basal body L-ring protein FlgH [Phycisphaerales bacterium]|nr:flagellar basal body L-ring protein FlgH [Phycisphaerales bacterium]